MLHFVPKHTHAFYFLNTPLHFKLRVFKFYDESGENITNSDQSHWAKKWLQRHHQDFSGKQEVLYIKIALSALGDNALLLSHTLVIDYAQCTTEDCLCIWQRAWICARAFTCTVHVGVSACMIVCVCVLGGHSDTMPEDTPQAPAINDDNLNFDMLGFTQARRVEEVTYLIDATWY